MEPPDSEESSGSDNFVHHPFVAMQARGRVLSLFLVGRASCAPFKQRHRCH